MKRSAWFIRGTRRRKKQRTHIFWYGGVVVAFLAAIGVIWLAFLVKSLPSPGELRESHVSQSTKLYDRTGKVLLYEIHGEEKRTVIPFEEIPQYAKDATLAAEDANFYHEPAFDWRAIVRALISNLRAGRITQGGSTISQQLVKNVFLSPEKTIVRKIKELILAVELESRYTKDEILALYLNHIPYGSNVYGIEAASNAYFNVPAKNLTLAQAATLASLLKAPTYYSPWGNQQKELFERKDYVLDRMAELGFISSDARDKAKSEKLKFAPPSLGTIKAPHFSLSVKEYLVNRYGENLVMNGGLRVITTLDWDLQQIAEKVVLEGAKRNESLYQGKNAALVAQDPKTGQILAMVGSRDYFDVANEGNFNIATQGLRQPGSALKPFAYLTAFEKGYPPNTILFDVPTEFSVNVNCPSDPNFNDRSKECFHPQNFDDRFRGPVRLDEALSQSINVPSVKVLYLAGFDNVLKTLERFGITTLKERWRYGLSLILGGGEVKLIELVNAYATLAQEGVKHDQKLILKVEDNRGNLLDEYRDDAIRVMNATSPRLVNQILSDKDLRSGLFQNSLSLTIFPNHEVALKTGTTNDYRDAWALGYTPSLVVGVWAGNNDNTPMQRHGSSILAAIPIWSAFLREALPRFPVETFVRPDPTPPINKPMLNGQAEFAPLVNGKRYPQIHSILYYVKRSDPTGPIPENPYEDSQFSNWERGVMNWARANIFNFYEYNMPLPSNLSFFSPISESSSFDSDVVISDVRPTNGEFISSPFTFQANLKSDAGLAKIELFINKKLVNAFNLNVPLFRYSYFFYGELEPQNLIELKVTNRLGKTTIANLVLFH